MSKTYILKLTSALVIDGVVSRAGEFVEVGELEAKNFLHRGKAEIATVEELRAAGIEIPDEDEAEADTSEGEPDADLSKLTKDKLLALAAEMGVEVSSGATKAQIIEAIEANLADGEKEGE